MRRRTERDANVYSQFGGGVMLSWTNNSAAAVMFNIYASTDTGDTKTFTYLDTVDASQTATRSTA